MHCVASISLALGLVSAAIASNANITTNVDACALIDNQYRHSLIPYSVAIACLDSPAFSWPENVREATLETVLRTIGNYYVYLDNAADPPLELQAVMNDKGVDLIKELKDLKEMIPTLAQSASGHREFHTKLGRIVERAKDGHLFYEAGCFSAMDFQQGFSMRSDVAENGDQILRVHQVAKYYKAQSGSDINPAGCQVTHIEGQPALDYLRQWAADNVFKAKDPNTNLNVALSVPMYLNRNPHFAILGDFALRHSVPETEAVTYTLLCSDNNSSSSDTMVPGDAPTLFNVTFPWVAFTRGGFTDSTSYFQLHCAKPDGAFDVDAGIDETFKIKEPVVPKSLIVDQSDRMEETLYAENLLMKSDFEPMVARDEFGLATGILNNDTGIIKLSTFGGNPRQFIPGFTTSLLSTLDEFVKRGVDKLIFDFTLNSGGIACMAVFMLQSLFPDVPRPVMDLRVNEFSVAASKAAYSMGNIYQSLLDAFTGRIAFPPDGYLFDNPIESERGGKKRLYSQKASVYCDDINRILSRQFGVSLPPHRYPWTGKDMMILTNGYAASAGSHVPTTMAQVYGVKTAVVGGDFSRKDMTFASVSGSFVVHAEDILATALRSGQSSKSEWVPQPFLLQATLSFPYAAVYNYKRESEMSSSGGVQFRDSQKVYDPTSLVEYSFLNADYRIRYRAKHFKDYTSLWQDVRDLLITAQNESNSNSGEKTDGEDGAEQVKVETGRGYDTTENEHSQRQPQQQEFQAVVGHGEL